jgi:mannose-6-phosphate isomerase-like protein (cupin superfamily)
MRLIPILALAAFAIPCCGQTKSKAEVFSGKDVTSQLTALVHAAKASGSSGATLDSYETGAIKLSVRTSSGGAEIHAHYDDIFFVTEGKATLVTGGSVVNPHTGKDGETQGNRIENGASQIIAKGDIVRIPAGTPHQLLVAPGAVYSAIVIKVKE